MGAKFFDWDENGVRENIASQPPPPPPQKKKKPPKKKKKKTVAQTAAEDEAVQDIELAEIKAVLAVAEPFEPEDERKPAALAHIAGMDWGTPAMPWPPFTSPCTARCPSTTNPAITVSHR